MGAIGDHISCKLVMPVLISDTDLLLSLKKDLIDHWGELDYSGELFPFQYTNYYDEEMGTPIFRVFFSFRDLIPVTELLRVKQITNKIEDKYRVKQLRKINLDPAYMSPGKFVLATTKNQQHRLYIGQGIFEEITLFYHAGQWKSQPWTYVDYRSEDYNIILKQIRKLYMSQVADELKQRSKK